MKLRRNFFKKQPKSTFKLLQKRLEQHSEDLLSELEEKHKGTLKWFSKKGINVDKVVKSGSKGAFAGLAAGVVLLSSGLAPNVGGTQPESSIKLDVNQIIGGIKARQVLEQNFINSFQQSLPKHSNISEIEADKIAQVVSEISGVKVKAELAGNRLNTNYGKIGLEQHLPRYPGETIFDHFESGVGSSRYGKSGLTRNRGAFGYFAKDKFSLTPEAIEQEKYYVVVQTFAIEGWSKNKNMREWYKHRKVMVVNTENGKAVVGVIADSGPAKWTGKSFGGSPELMDQLGMYQGNRKSKVLMFFVDDTEGNTKLGPL
mgnify:CR=1 FL=1